MGVAHFERVKSVQRLGVRPKDGQCRRRDGDFGVEEDEGREKSWSSSTTTARRRVFGGG